MSQLWFWHQACLCKDLSSQGHRGWRVGETCLPCSGKWCPLWPVKRVVTYCLKSLWVTITRPSCSVHLCSKMPHYLSGWSLTSVPFMLCLNQTSSSCKRPLFCLPCSHPTVSRPFNPNFLLYCFYSSFLPCNSLPHSQNRDSNFKGTPKPKKKKSNPNK